MTLSRLCFDDTSSTNGVWQNDPLVACRRCGMKAIMGRRRRRFERTRPCSTTSAWTLKRAWCDTGNLDQERSHEGLGTAVGAGEVVCTSKDLSAAPPSATLEGCAANVFACFQCWKSCNDTTSEVAWQIDPHTCARAHARTPMGERVQAHARDRGSIALTLLAVAEIRRVKSRRASTGRSASKVRRGEARPG